MLTSNAPKPWPARFDTNKPTLTDCPLVTFACVGDSVSSAPHAPALARQHNVPNAATVTKRWILQIIPALFCTFFSLSSDHTTQGAHCALVQSATHARASS